MSGCLGGSRLQRSPCRAGTSRPVRGLGRLPQAPNEAGSRNSPKIPLASKHFKRRHRNTAARLKGIEDGRRDARLCSKRASASRSQSIATGSQIISHRVTDHRPLAHRASATGSQSIGHLVTARRPPGQRFSPLAMPKWLNRLWWTLVWSRPCGDVWVPSGQGAHCGKSAACGPVVGGVS